jgi:hypothetical protein
MRLSLYEIDILRALSRGVVPAISAAHRVRLEMLGLISETPSGIRVTSLGERAATSEPIQPEPLEPEEKQLDAIGRKRAANRRFGRVT